MDAYVSRRINANPESVKEENVLGKQSITVANLMRIAVWASLVLIKPTTLI